ncbi:MAG: MATE family efflux transporter [Clostridia bacterium]|nr:MATE family efflux transporter [Clostridia bacterium]NCC43389.1 MATE family efflux transporter [Clostridia bacterium]
MNKKGDMTTGNPFKLILTFAIPMMLGNAVQQLYSMADSAIVGRFVSKNALAAIGATQSVLLLIICLIIGLTMGTCIVMSQYFGAGEEDKVRQVAGSAVYISIALAAVVAIVGAVITGPVLKLLGTPEEIMDMSKTYLIINTSTGIAPIAYNMTANIMRSMGDSKSSLYSLICSSLLNIVLDLIFVIEFNWGVAGAAWATVISQVASAGVNFWRIHRCHPILHLSRNDLKVRGSVIRRIIGVGVPMSLQNCVASIGALGIQGIINGYGTDAIAAYTAGGKIDQIAIMPLNSLGMAVSTYVGQNYGKRDSVRIKQGIKAGIIQSFILGALLVIIILPFRSFFAGLFVSAKEVNVIGIAGEYLSIVAVCYWLCGIMYVMLNAFRGIADMRTSTIASCLDPVGKLVFAFILGNIFGRTGIWFAWPIGWLCGLALPVIRIKKLGNITFASSSVEENQDAVG